MAELGIFGLVIVGLAVMLEGVNRRSYLISLLGWVCLWLGVVGLLTLAS